MILLLRYSNLSSLFSLEQLKTSRETFTAFIAKNYLLAVGIFCLLYITTVLVLLPITALFNTAAGYFFGLLPGTLYSVLSATIGACCAFLWVRYFAHELIQTRYKESIERFQHAFQNHGTSYLLFLQLLPVTPFAVSTSVASVAGISLHTFAWTTALGVLPLTFIYCLIGRELENIQSLQDGVSWPIFMVLFGLAFIALVPMIIPSLMHYFKRGKNDTNS